MLKNDDQPPKAGDQLFKNLFFRREFSETLELLGQGLRASCRNGKRLFDDTIYLTANGRFSSAHFLITTAREELAKAYILLDACRLDFKKHDNILRMLCKAFYHHIAKHAYYEIQGYPYPNLNTMDKILEIWRSEVKRWWPSSFEDGEPDMPHATWFHRERPLYIDFDDDEKQWHVPDDDSEKAWFDHFGNNMVSQIKKNIEALSYAESLGLFAPESLEIINSTFKQHYIDEMATATFVRELYKQVAGNLQRKLGILQESFLELEFCQWPLYHCIYETYRKPG